ncbi:DNA polymerase I [Candidatus Babeliales bacterium]|nr:DNA polymerase I [Candidatus Babeliales bacterium]
MAHIPSKKSVFIIDGSSFLYRAYYGLKPLHTSQGLAVHAVYGFCRMIKKLIDAFEVTHVAVVWDSKGKNQRHELFPAYKATRQEAPTDIFTQKELIQEVVELLGIIQIAQVGQEADDLMYSFAKKCHKSGYEAVIVSSDKDMRQVLSEGIVIYDPFQDIMLDQQACLLKYGFEVSKLPFYFALVGDSSDNIPGVAGVGDKTATSIVQQFKDLDDLYQNIDKVEKERVRMLLLQSKENAYLSYELFLLRSFDIDVTVSDTKFEEKQWVKGLSFFEKLEFKSFVKQIRDTYTILSDVQTTMFEPGEQRKMPHEKYDFITIVDKQQLIDVCSQIQKVGFCALDTETNGINPMQATLVGISLAYQKGQAFYIPIAHQNVQQLSIEFVREHVGGMLANNAIEKYMHNAKYDQLILQQAGFDIGGFVFDTMIAASLITKEWEKVGLKDLSDNLLQEPMLSYQQIVQQNNAADFSYVPLPEATRYAAADAHQTLQLVSLLKDAIEKQQMDDLLYGIELPINDILVAMQQEGIYCDAQVLQALGKQVDHDLKNIEQEIYTHAGSEINLNSPKQIRVLLFETLQLTPQRKNTKSQQLSTDAEVLAILAREHEVPALLLAYRELYKLKSTYIDALPQFINPQTGRIHTSWNQTIVATGRVSSSNPNLQNIPKDGLEFGKQYDVDVRSAFKAKRGWSFISADYSQIELRILAQLSEDKSLIQAFLTGKDIHVQTAAQIFGVDLDQVTTEQRNVGKRLNFSILYGLTAYGLSRDLAVSYGDAKRYIELYFEQYPGVLKWMDGVVESVKKTGYTRTLYGRRRYLPGIYERNKTLYDMARRIAINTPAQGTAAEITKLGMIAFYQGLTKQSLQGKILLQIHDELLVTCPDDQVEKTVELLQKSLVNVVSWKIPLEVSIRTGKTWRDVTK